MHRRTIAGAWGVVLAGLLIATQASGGAASNPVRFGNTLKNSNGSVIQPTPTRKCDTTGPNEGDPCTMVSVITSNFGNERAPKDGTIVKVRVVALHPGSFTLYFAKAHPNTQQAQVVKKGPSISYTGDDSSPYTIEITNVSVSVKKGWYIAVKASDFNTVSCTSGSPAQLEFQPPLVVGDPNATANDTNGCKLLVELQYQ